MSPPNLITPRLIRRLLFGKRKFPKIPNVRTSKNDNLYFNSLTRGGGIIGKPGVGKTVYAAIQVLRYALRYPDRPIISLDASGSFTNDFITLYHQLSTNQFESVHKRVVYDRMGDADWVVPFPFFSPSYGLNYEEQVQRVAKNFKRIYEVLITQTPVMGLAITETLPELSRLLCAIQDENGECWQITEAKKLLLDHNTLRIACKKFGNKVPDAKLYFEREFLSKTVTKHEKERRTHTLRSVLGALSSRPIRARLGYSRPGWTPKETIDRGMIVLVSGEELTNQEEAQGMLFTDVFSQILSIINKRIPHDPRNKPLLLIIDEVPIILDIRGMAKEIGRISTLYRSRNLHMIVIFQALWQLAENLQEQIWSLGNWVIFGIEDFNEAYKISQQVFKYDPQKIRFPATSETGQPIIDPDRSQYLVAANWLQHLKQRECIMKRYISESEEEGYLAYIEKTSERPSALLNEGLLDIKERLLKRRAISVKKSLELINKRKLKSSGPPTV